LDSKTKALDEKITPKFQLLIRIHHLPLQLVTPGCFDLGIFCYESKYFLTIWF
jgi:hypothetical protein